MASATGAHATLGELVGRSAAPERVRTVLARLGDERPHAVARLEDDADLAQTTVAVAAASRHLGQLLVADAGALDVLAARHRRTPVDAMSADQLVVWKRRELLRIGAADLRGDIELREVGHLLSRLADDVVQVACELVDAEGLAFIGMGKLGGEELNYSSDIDLLVVGDGRIDELTRAAQEVLAIAARCFRVDTTLRPEGRDGALVRSVDSFEAYWDRWAQPWEFQALLKARPVAGDRVLGRVFVDTAARWLWNRPFGADDLRSVRTMKARAEQEALRRDGEHDLKRAPGGIRDIEFSAQLLQLVHGRTDATLRSRGTLGALGELSAAGYIDESDGVELAETYTFLRTVEHRLQLDNDEQTHTVPTGGEALGHLARVLGYRDARDGTAAERLATELRRRRTRVRSMYERLWFRPLLEVFAGVELAEGVPRLSAAAADRRLEAFGFTDTMRTRVAVEELTRGLNRTSRLMQQLLPLVLDWLAASPDPDLGLLMLRNLLTTTARSRQVLDAFRESPDVARRLCFLLGTSRLVGEIVLHNPDLVAHLADADRLATPPSDALRTSARRAVEWRTAPADRHEALQRWKDRQLLGIVTRDLFGQSDRETVAHDLTAVADAAVDSALDELDPQIPFAVAALGRYGGRGLGYCSDLDVLFAYDGDGSDAAEEAHRVAVGLSRTLNGTTPANQIFVVDADLRPEGRQGALARSLAGFDRYWRSYAEPWERLAMTRARAAAGDLAVGSALVEQLAEHVWAPELSTEELRQIRRVALRVERERTPAGTVGALHLKLGRGALTDIEFTVQLLQLQHGIRGTETLPALDALEAAGVVSRADAAALRESHRFCTATRDRLTLVVSGPADTLPTNPEHLTWLARSLDTTAADLRQTYRRVTRRARAVTERLFYGSGT